MDCFAALAMTKRGTFLPVSYCALRQFPHRDRPFIAPDRDLAERYGVAALLSQGVVHRRRDQELRIEILVERLEPRRKIHGVADHGVFLAPRRADIAGDDLADVNADTDAQRPTGRLVDAR